MAIAIYVTSIDAFSGKTSICIGLGLRFKKDGFSIGYMKPLSFSAIQMEGRPVDQDSVFVGRLLGLPTPLEYLCPVALTPQMVESILAGKEEKDHESILMEAYRRASEGKDVMILEGGATLREGYLLNLSTPYVSDILETRELVVVRCPYVNERVIVDDILAARARLGDSMLGIVLNSVPPSKLPFMEETIKPFLERRGIKVYAIIPEDRVLKSITVGEVLDTLGGEIICAGEAIGELVEEMMVGAMNVDSALNFFRRKRNKLVITGGDRADIQLAALETSTKCIILTGGLHPSPIIVSKAEELGIPMILTSYDTLTTVELIEKAFREARFHQEKKITRIEEIIEERFDVEGLYRELGLR
jgi:BioD-like phosphotransacetylase family protein